MPWAAQEYHADHADGDDHHRRLAGGAGEHLVEETGAPGTRWDEHTAAVSSSIQRCGTVGQRYQGFTCRNSEQFWSLSSFFRVFHGFPTAGNGDYSQPTEVTPSIK